MEPEPSLARQGSHHEAIIVISFGWVELETEGVLYRPGYPQGHFELLILLSLPLKSRILSPH